MNNSSKVKDAAKEIHLLLKQYHITYEICGISAVLSGKEFDSIFQNSYKPLETPPQEEEIRDDGKLLHFQITRGLDAEDLALDPQELIRGESELLKMRAKARGESVDNLTYEQLWELEMQAIIASTLTTKEENEDDR